MAFFTQTRSRLRTAGRQRFNARLGRRARYIRGRRLIVRYNETAKAWNASSEFPIKLGFAVPLRSPNEGGLPDPDENASLDAVEDLICEHVALATPGVHALVLTTGVMKEYIFYIPAGVDIQSLHENIQSAVESHEVQCIAEEELQWETYHSFVPD